MIPLSPAGGVETGLGAARRARRDPPGAVASNPAKSSGMFCEGTQAVLGWVAATESLSAEVPSQFSCLVELNFASALALAGRRAAQGERHW